MARQVVKPIIGLAMTGFAILSLAMALSWSSAHAAAKLNMDDRMVPLSIAGEDVRLAVRIFTPDGEGPFPTLIFHHGSTGRGTSSDAFSTSWVPDTVIHYFVDRGWAVVLPSRRGRGGSEGLYDEGFAPNRADGYSCDYEHSVPGADRALADIDAVTDVILAMPFVDATRVVVGGVSRGGISSVAHAGRRPDLYRGVINFVGGWLGSGCGDGHKVNLALFSRGIPFAREMLWLYASDDMFYPLKYTRRYFDIFEKHGGIGTFVDDFPKGIGHNIHTVPDYWGSAVDAYLDRLDLPHEPTPTALRFSRDRSLPQSVFLGKWHGLWDGYSSWPATLEIVSVSSGVAKGEYRYIGTSYEIDTPIEDNLFRVFGGGNRATVYFYATSEDVLIGTYRGEYRRNTPRAFLRVVLTRLGDGQEATADKQEAAADKVAASLRPSDGTDGFCRSFGETIELVWLDDSGAETLLSRLGSNPDGKGCYSWLHPVPNWGIDSAGKAHMKVSRDGQKRTFSHRDFRVTLDLRSNSAGYHLGNSTAAKGRITSVE